MGGFVVSEIRHCMTMQSVASSVFGGERQGGSDTGERDDGNECEGVANHGMTRGR